MKILFLGTGTSHGIPRIACKCEVCTSTDPKNKRDRASILIQMGDKNILVDTGPDLRHQSIQWEVDRVDAVLYTHTHADHLFGLDDLRAFSSRQQSSIPCYCSPKTSARIRHVFDYIFQLQHLGYGIPQIQLIEFTGPFDVFGNEIVPIHVIHGKTEVFGFRIGKFAYVTDCKKIPVTSMAMLENLDVLVLGALRWEPEHWIHMTIPESLDVVDELRPKQTYLTHMMHTVEHTETNRKLPQNVQLAYDGLVVEV